MPGRTPSALNPPLRTQFLINNNNTDDPPLCIESETAAQFLVHAERLSNIGCFDWDIELNRVLWTDGLYRIFGLKPQEFAATLEAFVERVVPEDRERVERDIREALDTCGSFSSVERITHSSGEVRYLESEGEVIANEAGRPVRLIGVCRDVTRSRTLEHQVRHSQKMEAVGQLAAGIAHDFNNLLTVVDTYSELIMLSPSDQPMVTRAAESIRDASDRAGNLTRQLLMFSRPATQCEQTLDLNKIIEESEPLLRSLVGSITTVETTLTDGLPAITIDRTHLDQVLINLTVNARDAMPGGGLLRISTRATRIVETIPHTSDLNPGIYVTLEVDDDGIGMSEETRDRVFEPFFSTKSAGEGSGLGLAVVYGVVKEVGGHIQVESAPGKGTTIRILFPASNEDPRVPAETTTLDEDQQRVLLVEDEIPVRRATSLVLDRLGYQVVETSSAEEAIEILGPGSENFDLLLTDIVMPGMSGIALADEVRKRNPSIPVLLMSGYSEDIANADSYPYLAKPFSVRRLRETINDVLGRVD